ncbi:hypothetical protein CDAR_444401 [Caerostris darwini]|uniref:Secreted protein n=1 Tax=Caerostris darwini TaxID=1538125 RepID=A0AAV4XAI7_9ARAC|nr:hypothetical protein CDAR_444401 [Caerostris darwini]
MSVRASTFAYPRTTMFTTRFRLFTWLTQILLDLVLSESSGGWPRGHFHVLAAQWRTHTAPVRTCKLGYSRGLIDCCLNGNLYPFMMRLAE